MSQFSEEDNATSSASEGVVTVRLKLNGGCIGTPDVADDDGHACGEALGRVGVEGEAFPISK